MGGNNDSSVAFLYGTKLGRVLLWLLLRGNYSGIAAWLFRRRISALFIPSFVKKHGIDMSPWQGQKFRSFADFFIRKKDVPFDADPAHLISPCDSWLSVYPVGADAAFAIKGSRYRVADLLAGDEENRAADFTDGICLVFRLCPTDYHRYLYIDDGFQGKNHFVKGELHSVQPVCAERYPIYTLNRRLWTPLETEHFGRVIQTEIGALVVGGIVNYHEDVRMKKGDEMGRFEFAGSTITMLFQKDRIALLPQVAAATADGAEYKVRAGQQIGCAR
ncbi:MAG: phosphatidylserine decarboxylase [Treponema sp.]|nr:phosphatidylserine decarboxylase [Treponema sp.]